ncbi:hypothetical protein [Magnetospirillum sp. UT-4]|uniref:hypothetical protein n=1 Tax=Magnetospirillum sp. UT-4 TaxID=2681467 RepID=UPI00137E829B|nr:hypothetical protein [Magnetospirillum sp. UT-4]CAA7613541.1 Molecular chaperone distantly related to HSP70-fold metalloproteases [Magnetospirillum sp. UT-4]
MRRLIVPLALCGLLAAPAYADRATALKALKGTPPVVDATVDNSGNLYALVKGDSKIPWNVVAANICRFVAPHQGRIFKVRVVDLTHALPAKPPAAWTRLGEADCGR